MKIPRNLGDQNKEHKMTKYLLGGLFFTLGIIQLSEMNTSNPAIGLPITAVAVLAWIYEAVKSWNGAKR